jgi:hypothetical protein
MSAARSQWQLLFRPGNSATDPALLSQHDNCHNILKIRSDGAVSELEFVNAALCCWLQILVLALLYLQPLKPGLSSWAYLRLTVTLVASQASAAAAAASASCRHLPLHRQLPDACLAIACVETTPAL